MKKAIIATLILNSLIIIGVPSGHGYGFMIMIEYMSVSSHLINGIHFNNEYPFENSLLILGAVSLIGKLILIITLFSKNLIVKRSQIYVGLILLTASFIGIVYEAWNYNIILFIVTLGSGTLFLMYLGKLVHLIIKENKNEQLKK